MKKFLLSVPMNIPKLFWSLLCYIVALTLALVSGFFTFRFYTFGSSGYDFYTMGLMAISLEFIKLMFSAGYPFMKGKHKKNENTVLLIMKISLILSILASLYYLLVGKSISSSPASATMEMLYQYIPAFKIIPLGFSQFLATISLSVLIEFFIVFLPVIAPIMFYSKENRKEYKINNLDKLKEIIISIPENFIDRLYKKFVKGDPEEQQTQNFRRPKLKVYKNISFVKPYMDKVTKNRNIENTDKINKNTSKFVQDKDISIIDLNTEMTSNSTSEKPSNFVQNWKPDSWKNTDKKRILQVIYNYKDDNICPSVSQLIQSTHLKKNEIYEIKKEFEELGIIKTEGKQTLVLIDTYQEALKALKGGGVYYEG